MCHTQSVKVTYVGLYGADSNRLAMNSKRDRGSKAQLPLAQPPHAATSSSSVITGPLPLKRSRAR